jgi:hypothetical protein
MPLIGWHGQRCAYSIRPSSTPLEIAPPWRTLVAPWTLRDAPTSSRAKRLLDQGPIALLQRSPTSVCRSFHRHPPVRRARLWRPAGACIEFDLQDCPDQADLHCCAPQFQHPTRLFPTSCPGAMLSCSRASRGAGRPCQRGRRECTCRQQNQSRRAAVNCCGARTTQRPPARKHRAPIYLPRSARQPDQQHCFRPQRSK